LFISMNPNLVDQSLPSPNPRPEQSWHTLKLSHWNNV
jgi:hypothetical protein